VAVSLQYNTEIVKSNTQYTYHMHTNTQVTYTIHISHNIQLKTKQTKQISTQSHTNSGHITVNEYSAEKGEEIKRSLIQALETY
jgi:hypothetical protein